MCGGEESAYGVLVGKPEGLTRHWRILLKWIFKKWDVGAWTEFLLYSWDQK
jgi:hypothetical protein